MKFFKSLIDKDNLKDGLCINIQVNMKESCNDNNINLKTNNNRIMENINTIKERINNIYEKLNVLQDELGKLNEEYFKELENMDIVDAVVDVIIFNQLPRELYDSIGLDHHDDTYTIKNVRISAVYTYGYTDIIGLTDEQFEEVNNRLHPDTDTDTVE